MSGSTSSLSRLIPQTVQQASTPATDQTMIPSSKANVTATLQHPPQNVEPKMAILPQDCEVTVSNTVEETEEVIMKSAIPSVRKEKPSGGSGQRKRSRVFEEESSNIYVKETANSNEDNLKIKLDDLLQVLQAQIDAVFIRGERGKTLVNKSILQETLKQIGNDIFKLLVSYSNLQDEKSALQYQVIQLLQNSTSTLPMSTESATPATATYLQAAMMKKVGDNINMGTRLPMPEIPSGIRHAPSERVLIFKAEVKGAQLSKDEKLQFRSDVKTILGDELLEEVDVIRPTRNGGHTVIFQSEESRKNALDIFRNNERKMNIEEADSCIVAPKKKFSKVVCREPPDDVTMDSILNDFYGKRNVHLQQVPRAHRLTRIINTRFGWIFEMSSVEAAAVQAQGGRIRFGSAQELKVEEYISLQQCYRCCVFGHNAKDCRAAYEHCRLCGDRGHTGWECPVKDDRDKWRCANCIINNTTKGLHLPINHAAAQLHRCPCAQHQKEIRKVQLAASGIFTSPIVETNLNLFNEPTIRYGQQRQTGPQGIGMKRSVRSRSRSMWKNRNFNSNLESSNRTAINTRPNPVVSTSASSSSSRRTEIRTNNNSISQFSGRMIRAPRPKSNDGWSLLQINLGHRVNAHDALMGWLTLETNYWIICIQEPYFTKKGISKLPRDYGAFWIEDGAKLKRAAIIMPRCFDGYLVSQHSNTDNIVVRIEKLKVSVVSTYCPGEKDIKESLNGLLKESEVTKNLIGCLDTNAHHEMWGSLMSSKKWKGKSRGEELVRLFDEHNLLVCNEPPHPPTFVRDNTKSNSSHIDVTVASSNLFNNILKWHVTNDNFTSDHFAISFTYDFEGNECVIRGKGVEIPWKKPSDCMKIKMTEVLMKTIGDGKLPWNNAVGKVDNIISDHTGFVRRILEGIFRKKKERKGQKVYWWTDTVNSAYLAMRLARRRMRKYRYDELKEVFNEKRREFREVIRSTKLSAWKSFTASIHDPWEKLIKIVKATTTGKIQARTLSDLEGKYATSMKETLTMLSNQFFPVPDVKTGYHLSIENEVRKKLEVVERGPEITICEFRKALKEVSTSTAPGDDLITNNVVKILAVDCKLESRFVKLYNVCLKNGYFPTCWKRAKIVLIPKPTTNPNTVKSFRPISLTSSYGKLFERIILARLLHYLNIGNKMTTNQHAYRKGASTQTALYEVFSVAQSALVKRGGGICVAVFLDISGAFDATWHYGILHKLLAYGVPNYLVAWIKCFLDGRSAYLSESGEVHEVTLTQGCPQGGVLSPILWNVLFNEMLQIPVEKSDIRNDVMKVIGYADDAVIICKASSIDSASELINKQLEKIYQWSVLNRVKFNPSKLAVLTISNKIVRPVATEIYYNGVRVNEVDSYKYLGLLVDNKGLWNLQIDSTLSKLALITKSLRGLACGREGLSLDVFRILFHSIFMPVMLYGIAIWGWKAQAKTIGDKFDKEIRKFGLMATRCQKSAPNVLVFSLLKTKCFTSILQNEVLKTSIQQFHVLSSARQSVYETYCKNRKIREVPQCMDQYHYMLRRKMNLNLNQVKFDDVNEQFRVHPAKWVSTRTIINNVEDAIVMGSDNRGWVVYTDASASSYGVGWSFVVFRQGFCKYKNNGALTRCSIFIAEAYAVLQALMYVNTLNCLSKTEIVEIRSDAQGLVRCLEKPCFTNKVLSMIKDEMRAATFSGKKIVLRWVPGHSDIKGNVFADNLAKKAIDTSNVTKMHMTMEDVKQELKKKNREEDERIWENFSSRNVKLFLPDRNAFVRFMKFSPSVALTQVVSGHTSLNDFLCRKIGKIQSALCRCGKSDETMNHYLFECTLHENVRKDIWEDFEPTYEFVTKDWSKLNKFVLQTRRFDRVHWEGVGDLEIHK